MKPLLEAQRDIDRLALAFKQEKAFKFNQREMAYYERLYSILEPKAKARKHMGISLDYMKNHIC